MKKVLPESGRPKISIEEVDSMWSEIEKKVYPVRITGIRGYYKRTMGNPNENDRAIYDDCIAIIAPEWYMTFNANTDPSVNKDGVALLKATQREAEPYLYKIGLHGVSGPKPYKALRQFSPVTVYRDGKGGKEFTDTVQSPFFINIHKGGYATTSSLGCQTIHPDQWIQFISSIEMYCKKYGQILIPYRLIEY